MTLKEFLSNEVKIGEIVIFREAGHQVGMTRVDNEYLFIGSLSGILLELYDVVCYSYEKREWATRDVLVVDIKMSTGADYDGEL